MKSVEVAPVSPERLAPIIGSARYGALRSIADDLTQRLTGRTIWNVSSTATGGGVAELLATLVAYVNGAGVRCRWLVVEGDPAFFTITKRVHNRLHGNDGDGGALGPIEREHYTSVLEANLPQLLSLIQPRDIVILHDPQTAGLVKALKDHGASVVWRCHVGTDKTNERTDEAWAFLRPMVEATDGSIFSRAQYVPQWVDQSVLTVIAPTIDPFSVKNAEMRPEVVRAVLARAGIIDDPAGFGSPDFRRDDGSTGTVVTSAEILRKGPPPASDVPLIVQVSRWDRLKDMTGVLEGFARHVATSPGLDDVQLALVGPSVVGVTDDPEGAQVLEDCKAIWRLLPENVQRRIALISVPTRDVEENAAVINAIQCHAAIVVQKSLMEGFGLTVAEAMWKSRPVVASAVGGILNQITDGQEGLLVRDPRDLEEFGAALLQLLKNPSRAAELGAAARARIIENFLPDRELTQWASVVKRVDV